MDVALASEFHLTWSTWLWLWKRWLGNKKLNSQLIKIEMMRLIDQNVL